MVGAEGLAPLRRLVRPAPDGAKPSGDVVIFDASPWGGGAVLVRGRVVQEYFAVEWTEAVAAKTMALIGSSVGQTSWELHTLLLVLLVWGDHYQDRSLAVLGDNTASLQVALTLKSSEALRRIAREFALHHALKGWQYTVGHVPSELNLIADALSRLRGSHALGALPCLRKARQVCAPCVADFWRTS